jgi:hypothetical protein
MCLIKTFLILESDGKCVVREAKERVRCCTLSAKNIKQSIKTTVFMFRQRMNNNSRYFGNVHISLSTVNSSLSM